MRLLLFSLWFAACTGGTEAPPPAAKAPPPAAPTPPPAAPAWKVLAPSPLELEAEVHAAGITSSLSALVPAKMPVMPPPEHKDHIALRTGVVFAYAMLDGRTSEKPVFVERVHAVRDGMAGLGTGAGVLATMDNAILQIENDTATRDDFLKALDESVASAVPEQGWGPEDKTGPLLQAGAWLAGLNVAAKAVVASGDAAAADKLLRKPDITAFFLKYVQSPEGAEKAGALSGTVNDTLKRLQEIMSKPAVDVTDAKAIADATDALLALI